MMTIIEMLMMMVLQGMEWIIQLAEVLINPLCQTIFGTTYTELLGKPLMELIQSLTLKDLFVAMMYYRLIAGAGRRLQTTVSTLIGSNKKRRWTPIRTLTKGTTGMKAIQTISNIIG